MIQTHLPFPPFPRIFLSLAAMFCFDLLIQTHLPFPPLFVSPAFSSFFSPRLLPSFLFLFVFSADTLLFNSRSSPGLLPSGLPRHLVRPAGALLLRRMHARPSSLGVLFFGFVFGRRPRHSAFPLLFFGSGSESVIFFVFVGLFGESWPGAMREVLIVFFKLGVYAMPSWRLVQRKTFNDNRSLWAAHLIFLAQSNLWLLDDNLGSF